MVVTVMNAVVSMIATIRKHIEICYGYRIFHNLTVREKF